MSEQTVATTFFGRRPDHTPRLLVDPTWIADRIGQFRGALPTAELYFPVKCCPIPVVLQTAFAMGCGFEYASLAEVEMVRRLDLHRRPAIFGAPARPTADVAAAAELGVEMFVVDSIDEAAKVAALPGEVAAMIRLEVESSDTTMPLSTKFGVSSSGNRELARACADMGLPVVGHIFHVGSQTRSARPWARALDAVADARAVAEAAGHEIQLVDISGGFPVPYRGSPVASIYEIADVVQSSLERNGLADLRLIAEPGRFLVAGAGVMHTTVLATSRDGDHSRAVLDVGVFNGLYEVLDGVGYDFHVAGHGPHEPNMGLWQLAGPSCDGSDVLASERALPDDLAEGDLVVVPDAGAYAESYASDFCGLEVPQVVIRSGSRAGQIRDGVTRVNSSDPLFEEAKELELSLFTKAGLLDDDGSLGSYDKYDEHSVVNLAFRDSEPVGVLREIWPSEVGAEDDQRP